MVFNLKTQICISIKIKKLCFYLHYYIIKFYNILKNYQILFR